MGSLRPLYEHMVVDGTWVVIERVDGDRPGPTGRQLTGTFRPWDGGSEFAHLRGGPTTLMDIEAAARSGLSTFALTTSTPVIADGVPGVMFAFALLDGAASFLGRCADEMFGKAFETHYGDDMTKALRRLVGMDRQALADELSWLRSPPVADPEDAG